MLQRLSDFAQTIGNMRQRMSPNSKRSYTSACDDENWQGYWRIYQGLDTRGPL